MRLNPNFPAANSKQILNFMSHIQVGLIQPMPMALEHQEDIANSDLESIVMRYAHGECFDLLQMLLEVDLAQLYTPVVVYGFNDQPIHCLLGIKTVSGDYVYLDANGIHTKEDVLEFWTYFQSRRNIEFLHLVRENFYELHNAENQTLIDASYNFCSWISLIEKTGSCCYG